MYICVSQDSHIKAPPGITFNRYHCEQLRHTALDHVEQGQALADIFYNHVPAVALMAFRNRLEFLINKSNKSAKTLDNPAKKV